MEADPTAHGFRGSHIQALRQPLIRNETTFAQVSSQRHLPITNLARTQQIRLRLPQSRQALLQPPLPERLPQFLRLRLHHIRLRSLKTQMIVVGHQHPCVQPPTLGKTGFDQTVQETLTRSFTCEDPTPVIPTGDHVVIGSSVFDPNLSCHENRTQPILRPLASVFVYLRGLTPLASSCTAVQNSGFSCRVGGLLAS